MALFGKNKNTDEEELDRSDAFDIEEEEEEDVTAEPENDAPAEDANAQFQKECENISRCFRVLLPQQLYAGFYYAELQEDGYIDDFCCYAADGKFMDRQDIPKLCGLALPDMVAREEKLEQAFFKLRKSAQAASGKVCNALSLTMMHDGQVKVDLVSGELKEGEEEKRYNAWRERVDAADPKKAGSGLNPVKIEQLRERTKETNMKLGTEFFSMLPDVDFTKAYLYAENGENGVFFYQRFITSDGEMIDGDEVFERYGMDMNKAVDDRIKVVKIIMELIGIFKESGERPFTSITLSVTGKGEFQCDLGFGPTDEAGEDARIEAWKQSHT